MAKKPKPTEHKPRSAGKPEIEMGKRIRLRRVEMGLSQSELAKALGVSFQQVQKYEKGVNGVRSSRLETIAKALDVDVPFFFGGNGENTVKQQTEIESLMFLDSAFTVRLLRAYTAIPDSVVRRQFVGLMERVAGIKASD